MNDIQKEYEVTNNILDTLNSFKANPTREAQKYKAMAEDKPSEPTGAGGRDPDVWLPPAPVEPRWVGGGGGGVGRWVWVCSMSAIHSCAASFLCAVLAVVRWLGMHPSQHPSSQQRDSPSRSLQTHLLEEVHGRRRGGR